MKLSNLQTFKLSNLLLAAALAALAPMSAFAANVTVQVTAGQEAFGKVSGGKANAKEGSSLTLKATAAKGYGFCGWFEGSTPVSYRSSWEYTVEGSDKTFTAKFVAAKNDGFDISDNKPSGYALAIGETPVASACFAVTRRAEATSLSETTVKVSGLPNGVKAVTGTDPKKNGYVDFTGAPTKEGVYYVMFEAKNANGYVQALTQKWVVDGADDGDFDEIGLGPIEDYWEPMFMGKGWKDSFSYSDYDGVKKLAFNGLPSGLKPNDYFDGKRHIFAISGYPSKPGKYAITFTKTYDDNTVEKSRQTVIVSDPGSYYVTVDVGSSSEGLGTVSGSGVYRVGSKISLSAKPASKDYIFAGWFTDKACKKPLVSDDNVTSIRDCFTASGEYRKASDSMIFYYEAINKARNIYAQFLPKDSDSISLRTDLASKDWWETGAMDPSGKTYISYAVDSGTLPTVTAKGLPPGFKLDTKKARIEVDYSRVKPGAVYENVQLIAKNLTGLTDVKTFAVYIGNYKSSLVPDLKTNTDAYEVMVGEDIYEAEWYEDLKIVDHTYEDWKVSASGLPPGVKFGYVPEKILRDFWLYGVPSKPGVYTAVFTFTRGSGASKQTELFSFTITVYDQSPALIGTFNGVTCWDDSTYTDIRPQSLPVTITSAKGGKVTVKVGNVSFSGNGWVHNGGDDWVFSAESGMVKEADGKKRSYIIRIDASSQLKSLGELDMTGVLSYKDEGYFSPELYDGNKFFAKQNCYGKKYWIDDLAAELAAMKTMYFEMGGWSEDWITLPRTTDTKAPFKVTVDKKGVMKLSGKDQGISFSGSATLLPETDGSLKGWVPIYFKGPTGCSGYYLFRLIYKSGVPRLELKPYGGCG